MGRENEGGSGEEDMDGSVGNYPMPGVGDVLAYRKVTIAVVASYLGMEDGFVDAVLADAMDEFLDSQVWVREAMKATQYEEYVALLGREIIVRYAATAGETLLASPDSPAAQVRIAGDTHLLRGGGGSEGNAYSLGLCDDVNAVVRVHEIFEYLESPDASEEAEQILLRAKRQLCDYYNACAFDLVRGQLLSAIIAAAEELHQRGTLTAAHVRDLIIARE